MEDASFYCHLLDLLHDGILFLDRDRRIRYVNRRVTVLTGYDPDQLLGKEWLEQFRPLGMDGRPLTEEGRCPVAISRANWSVEERETFFHHRLGHLMPVRLRVTPMTAVCGGQEVAAVVVLDGAGSSQIMLQQRLDELYRLAHHDPLTGLANRRHLESALQSRMEELKRYGWGFGILFIDVDGFKTFNDNFGHEVGDLILIAIGTTMLNCKRACDIVGRWGGDEFLVILPNVGAEELAVVAERYRVLAAETTLPLHEVQVSVSVGGTVAMADDSIERIVSRADMHMYASKASGKNRVTLCVTLERPPLPRGDSSAAPWAANGAFALF